MVQICNQKKKQINLSPLINLFASFLIYSLLFRIFKICSETIVTIIKENFLFFTLYKHKNSAETR